MILSGGVDYTTRYVYAAAGASAVVLFSDHPYGPWRLPVQILEELSCSEGEREQGMYGNAERLFLPWQSAGSRAVSTG